MGKFILSYFTTDFIVKNHKRIEDEREQRDIKIRKKIIISKEEEQKGNQNWWHYFKGRYESRRCNLGRGTQYHFRSAGLQSICLMTSYKPIQIFVLIDIHRDVREWFPQNRGATVVPEDQKNYVLTTCLTANLSLVNFKVLDITTFDQVEIGSFSCSRRRWFSLFLHRVIIFSLAHSKSWFFLETNICEYLKIFLPNYPHFTFMTNC